MGLSAWGRLIAPGQCNRSERYAMDVGHQLSRSQDISTKVSVVFQKRTKIAQDRFLEQLRLAADGAGNSLIDPASAATAWTDWYKYAVDAAQRSILFWDTIRQRGNTFIEHTSAGLPPVLHFDYETIVDGRGLAQPVNYALVRIGPAMCRQPTRRR